MGTVSIWKCPRDGDHTLFYIQRQRRYWCTDCIRYYIHHELEFR